MAGCEDFILLDTVYCCMAEHKAKVYNLPSKRGRWKRLFFLDECPFCGHTVASLQECNQDGVIKILARKTDREALILRNKLSEFASIDFKPREGSFNNELILYNNRGIIYNFNDYKVGTNEEFCEKELVEITG